jgi:hypothetical protein
MHFNHANLLEAFKVYANEFHNLKATSAGNHNKCDLFWRQVIGFIQRGMPACDRQACGQGIYSTQCKEGLFFTFDFRYHCRTFTAAHDHSWKGLGFGWGAAYDGGISGSVSAGSVVRMVCDLLRRR